MTMIPAVPASWKVYARKIATDVVTTAASVSAILAAVLNAAPSIHLPGQYVAWVVTASSVVAAVVAQARRVAGVKIAAKKAPVPVQPLPIPAGFGVPVVPAPVAAHSAPVVKVVKKVAGKKVVAKKSVAKKAAAKKKAVAK